jgi:formylglycine-generating enzyme required for sulfatase activity
VSEPNDWIGKSLSGGRYRITAKLGEGGMGAVYRAHDANLDCGVVIKVPHASMLEDETFAKRFHREIRSLVTLTHPHIVKIMDVGEEEGVPFAVMQYLGGGSLGDRIGEGQQADPGSLAAWLPKIAEALDFIHQRGYVHRDIKPGNILFDDAGLPYVGDFGVVKLAAESEHTQRTKTLTSTGLALGTLDYMAPEMLADKPFDGRADQYALAVTVYELLCGRRPFSASSPSAVIMEKVMREPPPLASVRPELPKALSDAVARGMARAPKTRYADCVHFAAAVVAAGVRARTVPAEPPSRAVPVRESVVPQGVCRACPACGKGLLLTQNVAGRTIPCPGCAINLAVAADLGSLKVEAAPVAAGPTPASRLSPVCTPPPFTMPRARQTDAISGSQTETARTGMMPVHELVEQVRKLGPVLKQYRLSVAAGGAALVFMILIGVWFGSGSADRAPSGLSEPIAHNTPTAPSPESAEETLRTQVRDAISAARAEMAGDPEGARRRLRMTLELVGQSSGLSATARSQLTDEVLNALRAIRVEGEESLRIWLDISGTHKTEARYVGFEDGKVRMEKLDGSVARVPLGSLSQADQEYVRPRATITNSIGMKLVLIPAGEFTMGNAHSIEEEVAAMEPYGGVDREVLADESPPHRVRITQPFYLGMHEVTVAQFRAFVAATGYQTEGEKDGLGGYGVEDWTTGKVVQKPEWTWRSPGYEQADDHPVVHVSWNDAVAFCEWLSGKEAKTYRLPTEAEWEYACRAATTTRYYSGDKPESLVQAANFGDASFLKGVGRTETFPLDDGFTYTAPVGSFRANAFGLYDMHGNVWEWCADWYGEGYYGESPAADPTGPSVGAIRVYRGGSWLTLPGRCRAAFRYDRGSGRRNVTLGFRLALVPAGGQSDIGTAPSPVEPSLAIDRPPTKVDVPPGLQEPEVTVPKTLADSKTLANSIGMKLILIPAGEFTMGNAHSIDEEVAAMEPYGGVDQGLLAGEYPPHRVRITRPFYLGAHEVTVAQFRAFVAATGYKTEGEKDGLGGFGVDWPAGNFVQKPGWTWRSPGFAQADDHPVVHVSWNDAVAFCRWLSGKEARTYRLPTEAEWEYACRAGTTTRYHNGHKPESLVGAANFGDASLEKGVGITAMLLLDDGVTYTAPVGSYQPNAWSLYDMPGNVAEWCADWYGEDYYGKSLTADPTGPTSGADHVHRGGSWYHPPGYCRAAFRDYDSPDNRGSTLGFRLALEPAPASPAAATSAEPLFPLPTPNGEHTSASPVAAVSGEPAPPKAPGSRTWTSAKGGHTIEAAFVSLKDGVVTLEKADGTQLILRLDKLIEADQEYVTSLQK